MCLRMFSSLRLLRSPLSFSLTVCVCTLHASNAIRSAWLILLFLQSGRRISSDFVYLRLACSLFESIRFGCALLYAVSVEQVVVVAVVIITIGFSCFTVYHFHTHTHADLRLFPLVSILYAHTRARSRINTFTYVFNCNVVVLLLRMLLLWCCGCYWWLCVRSLCLDRTVVI